MVSMVIPVHNEAVEGARWLAALRGELDALGCAYEVLAVENGSTDGTAAMLDELAVTWPRLQVVKLPQGCYGAALKAGMQAARGDIIVNFDIDFWDVHLVQVAQALVPLGYEIIIGSKNAVLSHDTRPWVRRVVSWGFRVALRVLFVYRRVIHMGLKRGRTRRRCRRRWRGCRPAIMCATRSW